MLTSQKHLFSLPDDISYLNCAYMGPLPKAVELAGQEALSMKSLPYQISPPDFFSGVNKLRELYARLTNIEDTERIVVIPSVSYGIANAVKNIKAAKGQNIVMVSEIFPSNYYAWKRLSDESGAVLRIVTPGYEQEGRGRIWNEKLLAAIDRNTVAVALPQVHWADGTWFDLAAVRRKTYKFGAAMVIDGSQSIGVMPFDVKELQPDALIGVGYKWLLGAYGFGLAYYGERFDGGTPIEENWMGRLDSEDFQGLVNYQDQYKPKAQRYAVGENSQFIAVAMQTKSLEMILDWGVNEIQDYCTQLSQPYLDELEELGCHIEDPAYRGGHLFGIRLPEGADSGKLKAEALEQKVYVSFRGNAVRVSPHLYNEAKDFEKLLRVFKTVLQA